jgi:hypothetical protein
VGIAAYGGSQVLSAHPVPADDQLVVRGCVAAAEISLIDLQGRVMIERTADGPAVTLDTRELPSGSYILSVQGQGSRAALPIVVVH